MGLDLAPKTPRGHGRIVAAYSSFNWRIHAKTSLTGGLRYEFWQRAFNDQQAARQFSQLFPSLHFSHKPSEATTLVLNYTRRISRPAYNDLATNLMYNDPISVFTGNPALKPTLSQALKVEFSLKGKSIGLVFQRMKTPSCVTKSAPTRPRNLPRFATKHGLPKQHQPEWEFPYTTFQNWKLSVGLP
ncbi:MAG: TonB-dependent receptor [Haliscomenobacter sp.]|nr:TonB-dependent receptor [Haliscomenobacter sp.]MBK9488438.1 TonB-dependent receptor [Haliscomenobacter sp.]